MRRYVLFLPSLVLGLLGAVWLYFRPFPYTAQLPWWGLLLAAFALVAALLGAAQVLEKYLPSFRYASKLLGRALGRITLSLPLAFALAAASSLAEELFFRGALLPLIGVWGQALLFGLLHPAPRRAWSYTVFTFVAGLAFGFVTLLTGSLVPALVAHFVINFQGFLELRQEQQKYRLRTGASAGSGGLRSPRTVSSRTLKTEVAAELTAAREDRAD